MSTSDSQTDPIPALGDVLADLWQVVQARRGGDPESSYTAALLAEGPARCAGKLGEEAVEAAIAAAAGETDALAAESADLLYHLLVLWAACGLTPDHVARALAGRRGISGLAEKAARRRV